MKVTVFGAGNMGRGVGTRLVAGGNDVQILAPQSSEVEPLVEELQGKASGGATVQGGDPDDPVSGDVVVLAVWYEPATSLLADRGDQLPTRS